MPIKFVNSKEAEVLALEAPFFEVLDTVLSVADLFVLFLMFMNVEAVEL